MIKMIKIPSEHQRKKVIEATCQQKKRMQINRTMEGQHHLRNLWTFYQTEHLTNSWCVQWHPPCSAWKSIRWLLEAQKQWIPQNFEFENGSDCLMDARFVKGHAQRTTRHSKLPLSRPTDGSQLTSWRKFSERQPIKMIGFFAEHFFQFEWRQPGTGDCIPRAMRHCHLEILAKEKMISLQSFRENVLLAPQSDASWTDSGSHPKKSSQGAEFLSRYESTLFTSGPCQHLNVQKWQPSSLHGSCPARDVHCTMAQQSEAMGSPTQPATITLVLWKCPKKITLQLLQLFSFALSALRWESDELKELSSWSALYHKTATRHNKQKHFSKNRCSSQSIGSHFLQVQSIVVGKRSWDGKNEI